MENALNFQPDGVMSPWSWAALNSNITLLSPGMASIAALTLCVRVFFPYYRNTYALVTLGNDVYPNYLAVGLDIDRVIIVLGDQILQAPLIAVPGFWNSLCIQIDFVESLWLIKINEKDYYDSFNVTSTGFISPSPVFVIFGQRVKKDSRENLELYSFYGKLSGFSLWNRLLSSSEISHYLSCDLDVNDMIVKWEPDKMVLNDTTAVISVPTEKVCRPIGIYRVLLSPPLLLPVAESICSILKGNLSVEGVVDSDPYPRPKLLALRTENLDSVEIIHDTGKETMKFNSKSKWKRVQNLMAKTISRSEESKLALKETRRLLKPISSKPINNVTNSRESKSSNQANNPTTEKETTSTTTIPVPSTTTTATTTTAAATTTTTTTTPSTVKTDKTKEAGTNETDSQERETEQEEFTFTAYCDFHEPPVFRLNGFCPDLSDILEETYIVIGMRNEEELPIFQGFTGRKMTYARGFWIANSPLSTNLEMWFEDPIYDPTISPMGRNIWLIIITVNEQLLESEVKLPCDSEYMYLNLSPCPPGLFTCSNGSCLPLHLRCDRKADCEDNSDEDFCFKVDVPTENRNDLPSKPLKGENVTHVELKLVIIGAKIELDVMTITTDVWLTWKDPSLMYYNLHFDPLANLVDVDSLNEIWVPTLEIGNNNKKRIFMTNQSEIFVLKESFGTPEDYEFSWEATSYLGTENSLQLKERVEVDSKCTFNMFLFPLGLQTCAFPFVLTSSLPDAVDITASGFHAGISWSSCNNDLKYDIRSIELKKEGGIYSSQELVIKIYPRIGLALLTMYFPSLFIVVIAVSSFYVSPSLLQLRIGSVFGCLLAILVLQIQAGSPLMGKTGVNAADVWLFGALLTIFAMVISHIKISKDVQIVEEKRPTAMQVVPMAMLSGKTTTAIHREVKAATVDKARILSTKLRIVFTIIVALLIIIYIIVYAILCALYKE